MLKNSHEQVDFFANVKPAVPDGIKLEPGTDLFDMYEMIGMMQLKNVCLVLMAGGLGDTLGYSDLKLKLPVSTLLNDYSYLKYYAQYIKALEARVRRNFQPDEGYYFNIPFAIVTTKDTHDKIVQYLSDNSYFGLNYY